jgi:uncharacterized membrane protein
MSIQTWIESSHPDDPAKAERKTRGQLEITMIWIMINKTICFKVKQMIMSIIKLKDNIRKIDKIPRLLRTPGIT